MFSDFWNIASALRDAGFTDGQADAMQSIFAQCLGEYTHRGQLKLLGSRPLNATDAVLEVANYPHPTDEIDEASPRNGCALHVSAGKTCIDGAAEFNGPVSGLAANAGVICWGKALYNGTSADTTVGHVLGTVDTWDSYVDVTPVTTKAGTVATGDPTVRVYLWRDAHTDPNIRLDEVIQFSMDENSVGSSTHGRDSKIGRHQERTDIADPTSPIDYTAATGHRGWRVADGTNGTQNRGGKVSYGWTGAGAFATVGTDVTETATISPHAGTGGDRSITASGSITNAAIAAALDAASTGVAAGSTFVFDEETIGGTTISDPALILSLSDPGHSHAAAAGGPATVTVTGSVADGDIATALDDHTASDIRPAGETVLVLQRIN